MSWRVSAVDDVRDPKTAARRHEQARPTKVERRGRKGRARAATIRHALRHSRPTEHDAWLKTRGCTFRWPESAYPITTASSVDWHTVCATYSGSEKRRQMKLGRHLVSSPSTSLEPYERPHISCQTISSRLDLGSRMAPPDRGLTFVDMRWSSPTMHRMVLTRSAACRRSVLFDIRRIPICQNRACGIQQHHDSTTLHQTSTSAQRLPQILASTQVPIHCFFCCKGMTRRSIVQSTGKSNISRWDTYFMAHMSYDTLTEHGFCGLGWSEQCCGRYVIRYPLDIRRRWRQLISIGGVLPVERSVCS